MPQQTIGNVATFHGGFRQMSQSFRTNGAMADIRHRSSGPDTLSRSNAGVAQWQSPSLPSWPCRFDPGRPLKTGERGAQPLSPGQTRATGPRDRDGVGDRWYGRKPPVSH